MKNTTDTSPITRREAARILGSASLGALIAMRPLFTLAVSSGNGIPALAPGSPMSSERLALIEAFKKKSDGLEKQYEARTYKSDWAMPYRLFRPEAKGKLPLVVYLHGSGGQGDDNQKQLGLGNIFGTRVWLLPENQKKFPSYVLVPQSNRGWVRYDPEKLKKDEYEIVAGPGQGVSLALEVIDAVRREFPINDRQIYVTGQSMGGAGTWNMIATRPKFFAAGSLLRIRIER